ncbi:MAG: NTP transferase domain-containing protein [Eubacteriaceae bacterium]|nr:NTP transferase domain-containing protein [Eubacteriaceae bacterium]
MDCRAVILAGGKGTRMGSDLPKVLHKVKGKTLLAHVLDNTRKAGIEDIAVVVGHKYRQVMDSQRDQQLFYLQKYQRGTADAVKSASAFFRYSSLPVLVLLGDAPLISAKCIKKLYDYFTDEKCDMCVLSATLEDAARYGRILRGGNGEFLGIKEANEASEKELEIKEINSGVMIFTRDALRYALKHIKNNNSKKEYYLTDAVEVLLKRGCKVSAFDCGEPNVVVGANTPEELKRCEALYESAAL